MDNDEQIDTPTLGIHHVTAIAGDPQKNLDFYSGLLGLRLVKLQCSTWPGRRVSATSMRRAPTGAARSFCAHGFVHAGSPWAR